MGRPRVVGVIGEPYRGATSVQVWVANDKVRELDQFARTLKISRSEIVRAAIEEVLIRLRIECAESSKP